MKPQLSSNTIQIPTHKQYHIKAASKNIKFGNHHYKSQDERHNHIFQKNHKYYYMHSPSLQIFITKNKKSKKRHNNKNNKNKPKICLISQLQRFDINHYQKFYNTHEQIPGDDLVLFKIHDNKNYQSPTSKLINQQGLSDQGSTLNTITKALAIEWCNDTNLNIQKSTKFPVENGGGHEIIFSGDYIKVWMELPNIESQNPLLNDENTPKKLIPTFVFITPYDEIAYPLIIGRPTLRRMNYMVTYLDPQSFKGYFKIKGDTHSFDIDKDNPLWDALPYNTDEIQQSNEINYSNEFVPQSNNDTHSTNTINKSIIENNIEFDNLNEEYNTINNIKSNSQYGMPNPYHYSQSTQNIINNKQYVNKLFQQYDLNGIHNKPLTSEKQKQFNTKQSYLLLKNIVTQLSNQKQLFLYQQKILLQTTINKYTHKSKYSKQKQ
ncbi:MAG: hypothetical protein GY938_12440, partial [Ketobacter sp.]|nr:hypothetical protein [Ketobacter sp.]